MISMVIHIISVVNNNTIDIEIWEDRGDGILDMIDVEIISYEDFIKEYDGVELFVTKNI